MKFLIINTDYAEFLGWLYAQHPGLEQQPFEEQMRARAESCFGLADFNSCNLRKLGHQAWDVYTNNESLQLAWSREHGFHIDEATIGLPRWQKALRATHRMATRTPLRYLKPLFRTTLGPLINRAPWVYNILGAQIKHYQPDVLLNHAVDSISTRFLKEMKTYMRLLVGQISSPLPQEEDLGCYDLLLSSLPDRLEDFRQMGIPSELFRFGFEPRIFKSLRRQGRNTPISFVGSFTSRQYQYHKTRIALLEHLCQHLDVAVWGPGVDHLPNHSPIRHCYRGQAWGLEMYQILHDSKITLNHHGGVSGSWANNMRLFEATGVGTLLITDCKRNLHEMFEPGREVVTYRSHEECAQLFHYYLEHDSERDAIARAGQVRTLRTHTYYQRMQELVNIVQKYL